MKEKQLRIVNDAPLVEHLKDENYKYVNKSIEELVSEEFVDCNGGAQEALEILDLKTNPPTIVDVIKTYRTDFKEYIYCKANNSVNFFTKSIKKCRNTLDEAFNATKSFIKENGILNTALYPVIGSCVAISAIALFYLSINFMPTSERILNNHMEGMCNHFKIKYKPDNKRTNADLFSSGMFWGAPLNAIILGSYYLATHDKPSPWVEGGAAPFIFGGLGFLSCLATNTASLIYEATFHKAYCSLKESYIQRKEQLISERQSNKKRIELIITEGYGIESDLDNSS